MLPGNLINFAKRQRLADVIREIKQWQLKDFNLAVVAPIVDFIEEELTNCDASSSGERFWNLSLEREPREHVDDDAMTRLLLNSGFM